MARLSTHILDTAQGRPAAGVTVELWQGATLITTATTNQDGRTDQPLLSGPAIPTGVYELRFHIGAYYARLGIALPDPAFLDIVPVRFGLAEAEGHYHVPLLVSPFGYSTYRGS